MYTGQLYTFEVEINVNYQHLFETVAKERFGGTGNYSISSNTLPDIWFSFLLCDTRKIGFCNPIVTIFKMANNSSDTTPVSYPSSTLYDDVLDDDSVLLGGNDTIDINGTVGYTTANPQDYFNKNQTTAYESASTDRESKADLLGSYVLTSWELFRMGLMDETTLEYNIKANVSFSIPKEFNIRGPFFVAGIVEAMLYMTADYPDKHPHDPAEFVSYHFCNVG